MMPSRKSDSLCLCDSPPVESLQLLQVAVAILLLGILLGAWVYGLRCRPPFGATGRH